MILLILFSQLEFIHEVKAQYIFLTGYFPGQAFTWPQQGIYLLHLFTYHYNFSSRSHYSQVQQLKSLPSDCTVFYCGSFLDEQGEIWISV